MTTLTSKPIVGQTWIWADEFYTEVILLIHFDVDRYLAYGILLSSFEDNKLYSHHWKCLYDVT